MEDTIPVADSSGGPAALGHVPVPAGEGPPQLPGVVLPQDVFFLFVKKNGPTGSLGLDVDTENTQGVRGLFVDAIADGGAVHRANKASKSQKPPGDTLKIGDVIVQVNGATDLDSMISECKHTPKLRIKAVRRGQAVDRCGGVIHQAGQVPPP